MLEEHRNNCRPRSAFAYLAPVEYATKWQTENRV